MAATAPRDLDLVLWGATGYTGRLLARSVAECAPAGLRWALAGRDRARLQAVAAELDLDVDLVLADAHEPASLAAMARRAKVVASAVGPYALHGTALVAACVEAGSDYADLTGELPWMRACIDAFDAPARASGARVVQACGFDSVPSDLGVLLLQRTALERWGRPCRWVRHTFGPLAGVVAGGTARSALTLLAEALQNPGVRRSLADRELLAPGAPPSAPAHDPWWPRFDHALSSWTTRFPMAVVNTRVVRRTRVLLGEPWGLGFEYRERWRAPHWPAAAGVSLASAALPALLAAAPLRSFVERQLPGPGEGPSLERLRRGSFRSVLVGRVEGVEEPVVVHVGSDVDPGYLATARMLREVCFGLAANEFDAPGGVLTPGYVGGERLLERLQDAGIRFQVAPPGRPLGTPTPSTRSGSTDVRVGARQ